MALGGHGADPGPKDAEGLNGAFELAHALYERGYDAHMFRETDVENDGVFGIANPGAGPAYDEVKAAVERRKSIQAGVFGHSHGGGATQLLTRRLTATEIPGIEVVLAPGQITYTAYIDGVDKPGPLAENDLPTSAYHVNIFPRGRRW